MSAAAGLTLRPAHACERDALEDLQRRASLVREHRDALLTHPDAIELPAWQIEAGHVIVAAREGQVIGFSVTLPRADGDAELDGLFVDPAAWRGGIGRALVEATAGLAVDRGAAALHVIANPSATDFYLRCGFVPLGTAATRFGPAINMIRALG